ncbi:MAG: urease accessory protein [Oceanicoccus sp.]|jgi:urease accessory protein
MKKIFAALLLGLPMFAMAHPGHESISATQGLIAGALHPLMGLDHLLAFLALGVLLYRLPSKQATLIGAAFVALLAVGFYGAQSGILQLASTTVESLILVSVILSIACLGLGRFVGHYKSALLVTAFAVFHGVAHGVEVPAGVSSHGFALGFLLSTGLVLMLVRTTTRVLISVTAKHQAI